MVNLLDAPVETTSASASKNNRIDIRSIGACFCAFVYLSGGLSQASVPHKAKALFSREVGGVSTALSQALVYDNGTYSVSLTGLGDAVVDADVKRSLDVLAEIESLDKDWNGNGAERLPAKLIDDCRNLVRVLGHQPDIYPTAQDSIQFEWENEAGDYLEIEVFESGVCQMSLRKENGEWETEEIGYSVMGERIEKFFA